MEDDLKKNEMEDNLKNRKGKHGQMEDDHKYN